MNRRTKQRNLVKVRDFHWYVAMTPPGRETVAVDRLAEKGIATILPVKEFYRRKTRYQKKKSILQYPLMPRYLFVGVHSPLELSEIWTLKNVIQGFICMDGKPQEIPQYQVQNFVNRGSAYTPPQAHKYMKTHQEFGVGDEVVVTEGVLAGRVVHVRAIVGDKAHILLDLLGHPHNVTLFLDTMVPV
jgi:transcription termination/antitermination protein NusG